MKQFILNCEPGSNGQVRFEGDDYRYLVKVRRLAPGEYFPALLPGGAEVIVRVCSVDRNVLVGEISQPALNNKLTGKAVLPPIILFQALPKGEKMDLIVRQAAEGGIAEIVPFVSEFSAVKIKNSAGQKFSRWERIIKEARQQSGSAIATAIQKPMDIDGLFTYWEHIKMQQPAVLGLLFHHLPLANGSLHRYLNTSSGTVVLLIGPEGGFSPAEAERFMAAGFKPFTAGDTVLRTETAALYAQALVRVLLLERDTWETK
jgi:16S rRNA (uracil1498-N3)-methyltransferase